MGTTVTTSEWFRTYLSNIAGKHDIKELQTRAVVDPAHIFNNLHFTWNCVTYINSRSTCGTVHLFVD